MARGVVIAGIALGILVDGIVCVDESSDIVDTSGGCLHGWRKLETHLKWAIIFELPFTFITKAPKL